MNGPLSINRKILITGAFGYVGGRVSRYLAQNTSYELLLWTRRVGISRPDWLKNGMVIQSESFEAFSQNHRITGITDVVHLAAPNEIEASRNPEECLTETALGTLNLLNWISSLNSNKVKFIYFSTAHVYGVPLVGRIDENKIPSPLHPYSIAHKWAEDLVLYYSFLQKVNGLILRLSNSFGHPVTADVDRWSLLVNDLCRQAVTSKKLVLKSRGEQKRDFVTLTDVCRGVLYFVNSQEIQAGSIFNFGGRMPLSIIEMAEKIQKRTEKLFGYLPEIIISGVEPAGRNNSVTNNLEFVIDKLTETGFQLISEVDLEIDLLLKFCKDNFTP